MVSTERGDRLYQQEHGDERDEGDDQQAGAGCEGSKHDVSAPPPGRLPCGLIGQASGPQDIARRRVGRGLRPTRVLVTRSEVVTLGQEIASIAVVSFPLKASGIGM